MDVVIGLYDGFTSLHTAKGGLFYAVTTLRAVNPTCTVIVYCRKELIFQELRDFCKKYCVRLFSEIQCPAGRKMIEHRFFLYRDYLKRSKVPIRRVLCTDLDDVMFQADPFAIPFSEGFYCAAEKNMLFDHDSLSSRINTNWINEYRWIPMNLANFKNQPISCCGTILGTQKGWLSFLDFFCEAQTRQPGTEQGLWNIYIYNYSKSHTIPLLRDSRILTLDGLEFSELPMNAEGKALNVYGEVYAIVHMYNRCNPEFWKAQSLKQTSAPSGPQSPATAP